MKTVYRIFIPIIVVLLIVSGCSSEGRNGNGTKNDSGNGQKLEGSNDSDVEKKKEVVITVAGFDDFWKGEDSPGMVITNQFNEKYKGEIKVEVRYMPPSEYNTAIQAAIASNDLPDIFLTPQGMDIRQIVTNGWAAPLDDVVSDEWKLQFMAGSFQEGINMFDSKIYTWPLRGLNHRSILYYNKKVMRDAGLDPEQPPKTWDELREMAKIITEKGDGKTFGLVFAGGRPIELDQMILGLTASQVPTHGNLPGFDLTTGSYLYDSPAWMGAIELLRNMKKDGSIIPASYSMNPAETNVFFGENLAGFLIDPRHRMWQIKRDAPDAEFGLAPVPQQDGEMPYYGQNIANVAGYVLSATSKNKEEAGKYIEEAFGSKEFFKSTIQSGASLSPIDELNADKSLYPYPEYTVFYDIHVNTMREAPNYVNVNPDTALVIGELGHIRQPKIKPSFGELLMNLLVDDKMDVAAAMKDYNSKMNAGMKAAIEKVNASGKKVSLDDFIFPNWDPSKDYTESDYEALNK
ncbi:extracellular solute-binding protein [Paenibacillus sp. J5C_2022]|uniref:ABC transporter substrate-binding protein n=1 Tax=Paenibacillus sp. J5C2022 TaxID=2977129 RepID=UPI0021D06596|nr:extracellular solute-binding protein [Paenibacillus sp. J5C2022]MCU6708833.1 extracellular solute-binding protein [Paenibacillus sp. J5C2022]